MKLTRAFILVICAFTFQAADCFVHSSHHIHAGYHLQGIVDEIRTSAERSLHEVLRRVAYIRGEAYFTVNNILHDVNQLIYNFEPSIHGFFGQIFYQNTKRRSCSKPYQEKAEKLVTKKRNELSKCKDKAQEGLKEIPTNMKHHIDVIRGLTADSWNFITDCYEFESYILTDEGCVMEKVEELKMNLTLAVNEALQTLDEVQKKSVTICADTNKCAQDVYRSLKEKTNGYVDAVVLCVEGN